MHTYLHIPSYINVVPVLIVVISMVSRFECKADSAGQLRRFLAAHKKEDQSFKFR